MATTPSHEPSAPRRRVPQPAILPPANEATINRAREGLAAATNRHARAGINKALKVTEGLAQGQPDRHINPGLRRFLLRCLTHTLFRVRVENPENIPHGPCMLAPNHLNHIDPFLVLGEMPSRPFFYVLGDARTMYNRVWKRQFVRMTGGVIPLERHWKEEVSVIDAAHNGREDLADLAARLEQEVPAGGSIDAMRQLDRIIQAIFARGDAALIFPEGVLGTTEGQLRPLKRGAVMYAMRSGIPIVPVGLIGNRDLWFRKKLTVRFGKPIPVEQNSHPKPREAQGVLDQLENAIYSLIPSDYHEPRGPHLFRHTLNHMFW